MSTMYNDNHVDMLYNIDLYNIYRPVCHVDANGVLGCGLGEGAVLCTEWWF